MLFRPFAPLLPGVLLSGAVALVSVLAAVGLAHWLGQRWIDGLVLSIVLGTALRSSLGIGEKFEAGIAFCAKTVLEAAIVLLGATISAAALAQVGAPLLLAVAAVVAIALPCSYAIARSLGLNRQVATLVACGNSICGNSAIVAAAPAIGARAQDVASAVAFTAALGVLVVVVLPLAGRAAGMDELHYGVLAGMTVYAVPQVLAATAPIGPVAVQMGAVVKIVRVLMLGPVVTLLGLGAARRQARQRSVPWVPWFVVGFALTLALSLAGWVPARAQAVAGHATTALTVLAMAALGLSVDVRSVMRSGGRVLAAGALSLGVLTLAALGAIQLLY